MVFKLKGKVVSQEQYVRAHTKALAYIRGVAPGYRQKLSRGQKKRLADIYQSQAASDTDGHRHVSDDDVTSVTSFSSGNNNNNMSYRVNSVKRQRSRSTGGGKMSARDKEIAQAMADALAMPRSISNYRLPARPGELKGVDVDITQSNVTNIKTNNANSVLLNAIAPGTGSWQRVGRRVHMKSLRLFGAVKYKYLFDSGINDTLSGDVVRMVVVYDQQANGSTAPTWSDIFGVTRPDGTEDPGLLAPVRYDNSDRFKIVKDCRLDFNPDVQPITGDQVHYFKHFDEYITIPAGASEALYSGQSASPTTADISTGALYVYFRHIADENQFVDVVDASARLRYTDV
jgi:hypothetical protein